MKSNSRRLKSAQSKKPKGDHFEIDDAEFFKSQQAKNNKAKQSIEEEFDEDFGNLDDLFNDDFDSLDDDFDDDFY